MIEPAQRTYARGAGFLYIWLIVTGLAGTLTISRIAGAGTFAEAAKRVVASEHLYRLALCSELIETLSALVLAFALYVVLKPIDPLLAQMALYFRLGEGLIGSVGVILGFMRLGVYVSPAGAEGLVAFTREGGMAVYNSSAICFGIGSTLFCYLLWKSRYIPRILAAWGVFASVLVTVICFASLIFPEEGSWLQFGWGPIAVAEVGTGFWLMWFGVKDHSGIGGGAAR